MGSHLWLLVISVVLCCTTTIFAQLDVNLNKINPESNEVKIMPQIKLNDTTKVVQLDKDPRFNTMMEKPNISLTKEKKIPMANDPLFNKMLPDHDEILNGILKEDPLQTTSKIQPRKGVASDLLTTSSSLSSSETTKPQQNHKVNNIDSVKKNDIKHSEIGKHISNDNNHKNGHHNEEKDDDLEDSDDDYYYYYDGDSAEFKIEKVSTTTTTTTKPTSSSPSSLVKNQKSTTKKVIINNERLQLISGNDKNTLEDEKSTETPIRHPKFIIPDNEIVDDNDYEYDDEDEDDSDENNSDDSDNIAIDSNKSSKLITTKPLTSSEPELLREGYSCPMNCFCERNFNGFLVANCDRLDPETMKFDAKITDLEVLNVPPKYPLVLGPSFFKKLGLDNVSTIKIADTTIENIHPDAFEGLDELYSVNLTNCGLDMIHPNTFAKNNKLRIITLSGNDLHAMQKKVSPFKEYMLKSPSVEELYLSHCNLYELLPTAFNQLSSIVFIGLADNQLKSLPMNLFDHVEGLEELDLSTNRLEQLPKFLFNKTSLAILNLAYNEFGNKFDWIGKDLQKLDLSYNKITDIHELMFNNMQDLNNLILKGNSIKKIHEIALYPLKDLRHIDLSYNDLEQVSQMLFMSNMGLDTIRLNDNPRLKKLPLEGFLTNREGGFTVYLFDVSNCDLSELGDKTFSTMPHLTTLKLSWNNIENLSKTIFSYLNKLLELDLSNNLVDELNDLIFLHNRQLKRLNLAGNPLDKISSKVFLPTKELTDLDLSDCNLKNVWTESNLKMHSNNTFKNLKSLNVSNNELIHVFITELDVMDSLMVLDLSNNRLECNEEFKNLMKWLNKNKISSGLLRRYLRENAELKEQDSELTSFLPRDEPNAWIEYTQYVCKKSTSTKKVIDTENDVANGEDEDDESDESEDDEGDDGEGEEDDEDDDDESDDGSNDDENYEQTSNDNNNNTPIRNKINKVKKNKQIAESVNREDSEYDDDSDTEEDYEDEIKLDDSKKSKDGGLIDEEMTIIKKNKKIGLYEDEDEIIVRDKYYSFVGQYGYLLPIMIVVFSVIAILLLVAKIMSIMMRRRGERYRQALLASKNSIVYQKLSEDISGPVTPKFHRYAPINQV